MKPILMAEPKPLRTEFWIRHRSESFVVNSILFFGNIPFARSKNHGLISFLHAIPYVCRAKAAVVTGRRQVRLTPNLIEGLFSVFVMFRTHVPKTGLSIKLPLPGEFSAS